MAPIYSSLRKTTYNPVASAGPFSVGFPVFDSTGADLAVELDGFPRVDWTIAPGTAETGFFGNSTTWPNATISFLSPVTGALAIKGKRAPRRVAQYSEGAGVTARDLNADLNLLTAVDQELAREIDEVSAALEDIEIPVSFNSFYLGQKVALPTTDNDGNPLVDGALVSLVGQPAPADNAMYVRRSGVWVKVTDVASLTALAVVWNATLTGSVSRTLLAKLQEVLSIKDFGAVGDGVADDTAAYNNFMAALAAGAARRGYIPKGKYRLTSQPADIAAPVTLYGDGADLTNGTVIFRDYNGTANKGVLHLVPGCNGTLIRDMAVMAAAGTSGGRMLSVVATAGGAPPGFLSFENLYLSTYGTDTCVNTVYIDGSLRTTAPIGCRDISFKNCHIFGSNGFSLVLNGVIGLSIVGGGVYPAGGTSVGSGAIQMTAPGSPFFSQYVVIDVVTCNGLNLTNTNGAQIRSQTIGAVSGVSINAGAGVNQVAVYGSTSGTSTVSSWTNSGVYRPTGYATS